MSWHRSSTATFRQDEWEWERSHDKAGHRKNRVVRLNTSQGYQNRARIIHNPKPGAVYPCWWNRRVTGANWQPYAWCHRSRQSITVTFTDWQRTSATRTYSGHWKGGRADHAPDRFNLAKIPVREKAGWSKFDQGCAGGDANGLASALQKIGHRRSARGSFLVCTYCRDSGHKSQRVGFLDSLLAQQNCCNKSKCAGVDCFRWKKRQLSEIHLARAWIVILLGLSNWRICVSCASILHELVRIPSGSSLSYSEIKNVS